MFHWIRLFCVAKKLKYYACISILGSLAINYYFMKYFFGRLYKVGLKIKDHSWICLVVLSIVLVLLEHTFIEVKWNKNNMEFSIPYFNNKWFFDSIFTNFDPDLNSSTVLTFSTIKILNLYFIHTSLYNFEHKKAISNFWTSHNSNIFYFQLDQIVFLKRKA